MVLLTCLAALIHKTQRREGWYVHKLLRLLETISATIDA